MPRSPKSPARTKARVWKAWGVQLMYDPTDCEYTGRGSGEDRVAVFDTRREANDEASAYPPARVLRVEIREAIPAPVPPRSRKGGRRG